MRNNNRPMGVFKKKNVYQKLIDGKFYEQCPKAVFAALAVSYAVNLRGIDMDKVTGELLNEWEILFGNELVPQKPPKP